MGIFTRIIAGGIVGFYFAEKDLPFPVSYHPRPLERIGHLSVDLQIVDVITRDLQDAVGYGTKPAPPSE